MFKFPKPSNKWVIIVGRTLVDVVKMPRWMSEGDVAEKLIVEEGYPDYIHLQMV